MSNNTNTNTGNNNSVLGSWALYSAANDTSCNSAFGTNSLLKHTTGSFNTSLGAGSMTFNITGNRNVAVGSSALEFNTNSENNTAIGTQALFGQRDGSNNTAIGINAGLNDVSGSFNTYLGANTGTDTSLNTYTNSTALGYGAVVDVSNQIVLGTSTEFVCIPKGLSIGKTTPPGVGFYFPNLALDISGAIIVSDNIYVGDSLQFKNGVRIGTNTQTSLSDDNISVGNNSLQSCVDMSSYGNVAVGKGSLSFTKSYYNTAIGDATLMGNITGIKNTAIGSQAGRSREIEPDGTLSIYYNQFDTSGCNTFLGADTFIVYGTNANIQKSTAIGFEARIDASNQIVLGTTNEFVCIPSNRGLSIGKTTAPASSYVLDVSGSINFSGNLYQDGELFVSGSSSSNSISSGLFVSGDISGNGKLDISGDISGNGDLFVRGSVEAASYNATSDYRIKDNVRNLDEEDTISNLRPVKYLNKQTNKQDFGLIAHELQSEYPDLVSGEKDGQELQSVNYIGLISVLIKEVQELKRITAVQAVEISTFKKG